MGRFVGRYPLWIVQAGRPGIIDVGYFWATFFQCWGEIIADILVIEELGKWRI
jgi:hypothetical protein